MNVLNEYPTPWKVIKIEFGAWIEDGDGKTIVTTRGMMFDYQVLEFITETVNNSVRPRITDAYFNCDCGWKGIVLDCFLYIDEDGGFACPRCKNPIEVLA